MVFFKELEEIVSILLLICLRCCGVFRWVALNSSRDGFVGMVWWFCKARQASVFFLSPKLSTLDVQGYCLSP